MLSLSMPKRPLGSAAETAIPTISGLCSRVFHSSGVCGREPAELWRFYTQLTEVEAAFKNLKGDLRLRPIHHQLIERIEAHIFVAFLAYCLHVPLRARLRPLSAGLTPRAVLDKLAAIQMLDIHLPTTDQRTLTLSRHTEPTADQRVLLDRLGVTLPPFRV